jgi:NADPH:quinone reductase
MSIPATMSAAQLDAPGAPLAIRTLPVPRPGAGEVLVRIAASPINPSDLDLLAEPHLAGSPLPIVPGIEASGTVVAAGAGLVPRLWLGRRVACAAAAGGGGTWAEYLVTPALQCVPLARKLSFEQGAMLLVNPLTALAFLAIARRDGHRALVSTAAASTLGRMVLRLCQQRGLPAIHVVRRPEQADLLRSLGAIHVLDSSAPDFAGQLHELAHVLRATLLLDPIAGDMTQTLLDAAPRGSTLLLYGTLGGARIQPAVRTLTHGDKRIQGFYLPNWLTSRGTAATLLDARRVQRLAPTALQSAIQARYPLAAANAAIAHYQANMTAGKVLLTP